MTGIDQQLCANAVAHIGEPLQIIYGRNITSEITRRSISCRRRRIMLSPVNRPSASASQVSQRGILFQQQVEAIQFSTHTQNARHSGATHSAQQAGPVGGCFWHNAIDTRSWSLHLSD
jgi:hypothetical protein